MKMPKAFAAVKGETVVFPKEKFVELNAEGGGVEACKEPPRNNIKFAYVYVNRRIAWRGKRVAGDENVYSVH